MRRLLFASLMMFQWGLPLALAQDAPARPPEEQIESVVVPGIKDPELYSYKNALAGLDAFERDRHMAPRAEALRYRIKPKHDDEPLAGLVLRVAGNETSFEIPLAPDGTFVLPRNQAALDDKADLVLNRKRGAFHGMPHIRSAGVPPHMRRLGDIRLECRVAIAVGKTEINFALRAVAALAMGGTDWCKSSRIDYGTDAPYPSDSMTLVSGARRSVLAVGRQQKYFKVPINDSSWPDDTLIEFQASAPPTVEHFAAQPLSISGTMNKWAMSLPLTQLDARNYRVDVALPKGLNKFRVLSQERRMVDLGAGNSRANEKKGDFTLNAGKALAWGGPDIWFEPPAAGIFTFHLNVADPKAPVLTITPAGPP